MLNLYYRIVLYMYSLSILHYIYLCTVPLYFISLASAINKQKVKLLLDAYFMHSQKLIFSTENSKLSYINFLSILWIMQ